MTSQDKGKSKSRDRGKSVRGDTDTLAGAPTRAAAKPSAELKWHELAAFHVTFDQALDADERSIWRTHVYHEESGAEQMQTGILDHSLIAWMRERAGLPLPSEAPHELPSAPTERAPAAEATVAHTPLSLGEFEVAELLGEREIGEPETDKRLRARLHFDLAATAEQPIVSTGYVIQLIGWAEGAGEALPLASLRAALQPSRSAYVAELDFAVPPLGSYQLAANVLLAEDDLAAVMLGPVLTVTP